MTSMISVRPLTTLALAITFASLADAQTTTLFPEQRGQHEQRGQASLSATDAFVDVGTRWAFRTRSPVTVSSPIVRLGDIIEPMIPDQAGWQRLSRAAVGLVPVSGERMTIQRDRLNQIMLAVEATPRVIDWHGPTEIHVDYRKAVPPDVGQRQVAEASRQAVRRVDYQTSDLSPADAPEIENVDHAVPITSADADRIVHWIKISMKRFYPEVEAGYAIHVPMDQDALEDLRSLYGVNDLVALTDIGEGTVRFLVVTRKVGGEVRAEIEVHLTAHPKVVVPSRSLGRGHRITAADLELKPFSTDQIDPQSVVDIESLIGQEVRGTVRTGQPILRHDVGPPILIHRGDLIELRVVGGGVNVTTNAKALGDGAASDLIEIETMNPRKRLVGRVADHGTVEIVTRAPQVRP